MPNNFGESRFESLPFFEYIREMERTQKDFIETINWEDYYGAFVVVEISSQGPHGYYDPGYVRLEIRVVDGDSLVEERVGELGVNRYIFPNSHSMRSISGSYIEGGALSYNAKGASEEYGTNLTILPSCAHSLNIFTPIPRSITSESFKDWLKDLVCNGFAHITYADIMEIMRKNLCGEVGRSKKELTEGFIEHALEEFTAILQSSDPLYESFAEVFSRMIQEGKIQESPQFSITQV